MSDAASNSKTGNLRAAEAGSRNHPNSLAQGRTRFANRTISSGPFPWLIGVGICLLWLLAPTPASAQVVGVSVYGVSSFGVNEVDAMEKWQGFDITGALHGSSLDGQQVTVTINGGPPSGAILTTTSDAAGDWSVTVPANSDYIFHQNNQTVQASVGGISHTRQFDGDLTLPLNVDAVTGDDVINAPDKDDGFEINGRTVGLIDVETVAISGVTVSVTVGGVNVGSALSDSTGSWTVAVDDTETSHIAEPNAAVVATASRTGYVDRTVSRTVTVDLTVSGAPAYPSHQENSTALGTYTASGISGTLTWRLSGDDRGDFDIGAGGVLAFAEPPDYEDPDDDDTDNEYLVTVEALDDGSVAGTLDVTVDVTNVNEAPVVSGSRNVSRVEGDTLAVRTYTASDPENDPVTWDLLGEDVEDFTIDANSGALSFANPPDYDDPADADTDNVYKVTVRASDGGGLAGTRDVTVTVTGVDEPPVVSGRRDVLYAENSTRPVQTYTASDPEGAAVTWSLSGDDADHFSISNDGVLTFDSPPDFDNPTDADAGNDYLVTVQASDGDLTGTLDVTVSVIRNRPPVWSGEAAPTYPENTEDDVTFTLSDPDGDGALVMFSAKPGDKDGDRLRIITAYLNQETLEGHVAVRFRDGPPDYENPTDSDGDNVYEITLRAVNAGIVGAAWAELPVAITVTNVDEAPVALDDTVDTDEDTPVPIAVLDNDAVDATATPLEVIAVGSGTAPSNGSVALDAASNTVTYTPDADFHGTDTFDYTVSETVSDPETPARTDTATVTVRVAAVNDTPVAVDDSAQTFQNDPVVIDVLANDTDADTDDTLTVSAVGIPVTGTAAINSGATAITYTPDFNFTGDESFSYTVSDGTATASGMVTVTVKEASHVADLSLLTISPGTLTPAFAAATTSYTVDVASDVASVRVTPTTDDTDATVTVNGTAVDSGSASDAVALVSVHPVTITVQVTAQDKTTTATYTVPVLKPRVGDPRLSFRQSWGPSDSTRFGRRFDEGQLESCLGFYGEAPCPDNESYWRYTAAAASNAVEVRFQSDGTWISAAYSTESVSGNNRTDKDESGSVVSTTSLTDGTWTSVTLEPGKVTNVWTTFNSSGGGTRHTVTEISTCYVAGLALADLTLQAGTTAVPLQRVGSADPGFASDVAAYTASVANAVKSVTVTPTLPAGGCPTVTVNGTAVAGGSASGAIRLQADTATTITVAFTNGSSRDTYTIDVTRAADRQPAFDSGASVADQSYKVNDEITSLTLPAASGGDGTLVYTLTPNLPTEGGLALDPATRQISGTPKVEQAATDYTWTVTDTDGDADSLTFSVTVAPDLEPRFGDEVADQLYKRDAAITSWDLPAASGGDEPLTYTLTPDPPQGLGRADRTISGTPSANQAATDYTWTATDTDGDADSVTFSIRVADDFMPSFVDDVADQTYTVGVQIEPFVLPEAAGGDKPLTYRLTPDLPSGLEWDEATRTISETPTADEAATYPLKATYTLTATDTDGDEASVTFSITITEDLVPSFVTGVGDQSYPVGRQIQPLTLPSASGGNGALVYELSQQLPEGLELDMSTRQISGNPTALGSPSDYGWTATDTDGDVASVAFSISLTAAASKPTGGKVVDLVPAFVDGTGVGDRVYTVNREIEPLVLPEASGGDGALTYTLTPELPAGLALDGTTRTVSGTPTAVQERTEYTWTATDRDKDTVSVTFSITIVPPPSFGDGDQVADQVYKVNAAIEPLVLPEASGGKGRLGYVLTPPELPAGLILDDDTRTISGTPTAVQERTAYTWTATDMDGDTASVTFSITIVPPPSFDDGDGVADQVYKVNAAIEPLLLPGASGGIAARASYTLTPALPAGLALDDATQTVSGTPTTVQERTAYTWTATDVDGDTASVAFSITIVPPPSFGDDDQVADQVYKVNAAIEPLELPEASGGIGPLSYTLTPALPAGLALDDATRTVSGTPTVVQAAESYTWTATDVDGDTASVAFSIAVAAPPSFGDDDQVADQVYKVNAAIEPLELPEASGGIGPLSYTLTPALPAGLALDDATRTVSGTPTVVQAAESYTWTATDVDGDTASVTFSIAVAAPPSFSDDDRVADQVYKVNAAIAPLVLPEASGGIGPLSYTLTPSLPAGLALDDAARTVSGTPTVAQPKTLYAWTATDVDGDTASVTFSVTVRVQEPRVIGSLPPLTLYVGGASERVEAREAIAGYELSWVFESRDAGIASVEPDGSVVVVTPVREGGVQVTVAATNVSGSVSVTFDVTVRTSAAEAAAIRAALAGQARVVLGSVTDVIAARIDGARRPSIMGGESRRFANHGLPGSYDPDLGGRLGGRSLADDGVWNGNQHDANVREGSTEEALSSLVWGRSFSLALGDQAASGGDANTERRWHLWGAADLQRASGAADHSDFDGEWRFLYLGLDREFNERWLGGVSLSHVWGEADYTFADDTASGAGRLSSTLTGVYPYLQGRFATGLGLWAIGGLGFGDVANVRAHAGGWRDAGNLDLRLAVIGLRQPLSRAGSLALALASDAGLASLSTTGDGSLDGAQASVRRLRLGLEMAARSAGGVEPFVHVHGRYDGGDGPGGAAAEMVLGVRYAGERLRLEIRGNYLASAADVEQWGANAQLGYGPRADGRGLSGSLTTRLGAPDSGRALLDGPGPHMPGSAFASSWGESASAQVSGEIGYGVAVPPLPGSLTPNMGYDYRDGGAARARVGVAYQPSGGPAGDLRLRLDVARSERRQAVAEHSIELSAVLRF